MTGRPPSSTSRRNQQIKVMVTAELYELIKSTAEREGRTMSDWGGARAMELAARKARR